MPPNEKSVRGRPRVWATDDERRQVHQARRRERERQVTELLQAVRNAWWDEPELHRLTNYGDDLELLAGLTEYYRRRHWMWGRPAPQAEEGAT
jgi:hypothetical protein